MGRELRRVPLDFAWPLNKMWGGYEHPKRFEGVPCPQCSTADRGLGYSERGRYYFDLWYGYQPFDPADNGSTPHTTRTPAIRALAERNVERDPYYYGSGEEAIEREARRLCEHFNSGWQHHLSQADVDVLVEDGRLSREFDHHPSAKEVNEWALTGLGVVGCYYTLISARCAAEGVSDTCETCDGHGSTEAYAGQRAESEAWEWIEPPEGEGYQLWETTSEGSPISPVFETLEELCDYAADNCTVFATERVSAERWRSMLDADFVHSEYADGDGNRVVFI